MKNLKSIGLVTSMVVVLCSTALGDGAPQPPAIDLSRQPTLYVVGYAHLDTQWRWTYATTIREYIGNTLRDNFALMDKYPSYVFNFSGSRRYEMMKEYYPGEYEKLHKYVASGQWFPCGSSVDENDANVPSAESLVRQVLYGNRFFRREFGIASDEFMLPDCFGFPAALPSVLAHCGIKGFSTQKLTWGSAVGIPFKVGVWEGPDGSSVIAALDPGAYVGEVREDLSASDSWLTRINNNGKLSGVFGDYHYYGTGDMGGAPTEASVAMIEKSVAGKGPLKIVSGPSDWLFKAITPELQAKLPRYRGELLLTEHSAGSITSQSYMKRWNRMNEQLADAAEKAATAAWWLGAEYPARRLENAWSLVLGSQMHDILPGTSHPKAYEYSWNDELLAANQFAAVLTDAVGAVSGAMNTQGKGNGYALVVFNPLSIEREDVVQASLGYETTIDVVPQGITVTGPDGKQVSSQVLGGAWGTMQVAFLAKVPPIGFAVFNVDVTSVKPAANGSLKATDRSLENDRYRVELNDDGDVASVFDKKANREMLSAPARLALMYEKPAQWPAWNMDWKDRQLPPRSFVRGPAKFRVVENGPVRVALEVTREQDGSTYVQTIRLASGDAGDRIEFDNTIDWTTRERSLKATFPLAVSNPKATYDIQTGAIERDNNNAKRYENPSHLWFDLTDVKGDYGVTVMNDSKFGSDKPDDSTLRLTLLYTPGTSGDYQDQGTQDIGRHHILYALAGHQGDWRGAGTPWVAARLNQPLRAFVVPAHGGALGKSFSLLTSSNPNVMISAVKKAENGDQVVARLRELTGADANGVRVSMNRPIAQANEVDGQERPIAGSSAKVDTGALATDVRGFGLRAFTLKPGEPPAKIAKPVFKPLAIPFSADVASLNSKRDDGSIDDQGRTFPAEQLGSVIECGGVTFQVGATANGQKNAVLCRGQDIALAGDFDRVELLAASADGDQRVDFRVDGMITQVNIPSWRGYIGQWDNRVWIGKVPEVAFNWQPAFGGLEPGYVKQAEVAWFCSHHHTASGDQPYEYCYLFKIGIDLPKGAKSLSLPNNEKVMVLAALLVKTGFDRAIPAAPLFDTLDDRTQDAPRISPAGGSFADTTQVRIEPRLYGHADSIRFTLDGNGPTSASSKYQQPIVIDRPTTIRAAALGADGKLGPEQKTTIVVNDQSPPYVLAAEALYNQPVIHISFSEPLEKASATAASNYSVDPGIAVTSAVLEDSNGMTPTVVLTLDSLLEPGKTFSVQIRSVKDNSPARNSFANVVVSVTAPAPVFHLIEVKPEQRGEPIRIESGLPVGGHDFWTLNLFVRTDKQPPNRTVIAGFGAITTKADGGARYLCKFGSGIHFWSHHCDLQGNAPLDLNRWQMITTTYDGSHLRLYKDGKLLGEREAHLADDEPVVCIAPLDPWDKKRRFEGEVREMTIWNVALNEEAIQSLQTGVKLPRDD